MYQALQGNLGLAKAIEYFTSHNITVSIPLNDTQPYDLIADIDGSLKKISVKTGRSTKTDGRTYSVQLRNTGGGRTNSVRCVLFDNTTCDYVFIYTIDENIYLIPAKEITAKSALTVGDKKSQKYKVFIKLFKESIDKN